MQRLLRGLVVVMVAYLAMPVGAMAVSTPKPTPSTGQGLEISPPVIQLTANPGQTITTNIRVRNVATGTLIASGKADDFGAGTNEDGQPQLLLNESGATRYSLKYWIQSVPDLRLDPQELKTVTVTIAVPANAEPGGHFGVVRFTGVPPSLAGTGVSLSASVGTLILLKVNGPVTDKVTLEQFATHKGAKIGSFFEYGPVDFLVRLHNVGTVHEAVTGAITVTNMLGKKVGTVSVNNKATNVLPDSIRRYDQTLNDKHMFGHYTAKLVMTYATGQVVSASLGFWVLPWRLILVVIIGVLVLLWLVRLGIRRYNAYIIRRAGRG